MNDNNELIEQARKSYRSLDGVIVVSPRLVADLADALEATRPRTVASFAGLDALPENSVIITTRGDVHQKRTGPVCSWWDMPGDDLLIATSEVGLPVAVVYAPEVTE